MPIPAWNDAWIPMRQGSVQTTPRNRLIEFEDYEQRVARGLRNLRKKFTFTFRYHYTICDQIEAFLAARNGTQSFSYTDKTTGGDVVYRVVADEGWTRRPGRTRVEEMIDVTFREVPLEWP